MIRRTHVAHAATLLALASFPACGGKDEGTGGPPSTSPPGPSEGGGEAGAVSVRSLDVWIGEKATVEAPQDLSKTPIEALVPMGGGQWQTFEGKGKADGSVVIPGVPEGPYVLHVGEFDYIYTSARDIDLGGAIAGRKDAPRATVNPTKVTLDITNLDPWKAGDDIQLFVPNSGAGQRLYGSAAEDWPAVGDTTLDRFTVNWSGFAWSSLIDASKGDVLTVSQLSQQTGASGVSYAIITRFASFDDITQTDGSTVSKSGAFTSVPSNVSASLDVRTTKFTSHLAAVNPKAVDQGTFVEIHTRPGNKYAPVGSSATLLSLSLAAGSADVNLGAIPYGNPYPADWGSSAFVYHYGMVTYTAPGVATPWNDFGAIMFGRDVASVSGQPIEPPLSPVQDLEINGKSAFSDQTGVTRTPRLSWTAPAVGTPTHYTIEILKPSEFSYGMVVARLHTKDTKVDLPPRILEDVSAFYVRVQAHVSPVDITTHPYRSAAEFARADALSNILVP
ncbi:hypothetical protein KEG38_06020 [Polyangium jinanense]|uniref:hypothetical protein n=1 Tax=Polyangium jinanense TaxID=2829994 RepID=UPI002340F02B|nr:hypothetical protein [Polyangium jinanense]MDC3953390.1 hypothetical protein [Polyangium jinanense]